MRQIDLSNPMEMPSAGQLRVAAFYGGVDFALDHMALGMERLGSDAGAFNATLRRIGFQPRQPGRWPARNLAKAYGWRLLRRLGAG